MPDHDDDAELSEVQKWLWRRKRKGLAGTSAQELRTWAAKPHLKRFRMELLMQRQRISEMKKHLEQEEANLATMLSPDALRRLADKKEQAAHEYRRREQEWQERKERERQRFARQVAEQEALPYTVLGLTPGASEHEIKTRYRELAKQHHPDSGGDSARFREITAAYKTLVG
jgi:DnaJ-domain-containing protein 1